MPVSRNALALLALLTGATAALAAEAVVKPRQVEIYSFAELVKKADQIVVAEVGPTTDGVTALTVQQVLKAPRRDPKQVDPETIKRAEALLKDDKLELPPPQPKPLKIAADKALKLPAPGTQAIFFLWEKLPVAGETTVYQINHPQSIYDAELLSVVRLGTNEPRKIPEGRYLRDWDRRMAERLKERQSEEALAKLPGGEIVMGLRIKAMAVTPSVRGNNSFGVRAVIENTRKKEQMIYDGPAGGFGAILRPAAGEGNPITLRLSMKTLAEGTDRGVINIADAMDFATVPGDSTFAKELFFDAKEFAVLKELRGDYLVSVFYASSADGKSAELETAGWTGAIVSEPVALHFGEARQAAK
jgi:hypothetical protein